MPPDEFISEVQIVIDSYAHKGYDTKFYSIAWGDGHIEISMERNKTNNKNSEEKETVIIHLRLSERVLSPLLASKLTVFGIGGLPPLESSVLDYKEEISTRKYG